MTFRTRLTLFFLLIVVVPMVVLGVVVVRQVSENQQGKATAENRAYAAAAVGSYARLTDEGTRHAREIADDDVLADTLASGDPDTLRARVRVLADQLGLARVRITRGGRTLVDVGDPRGIAGASIRVQPPDGGEPITIEASTTTADRFAKAMSTPGVDTVVRRDGQLLASTLPVDLQDPLPDHGTVDLAGVEYRVATFRGADFGNSRSSVIVLTDTRDASGTDTRARWIAIGLLALLLLVACVGALLISRQLNDQLERFLAAARRIGGGDFSASVPVEGDDEFASLGREFNKMSHELEHRLHELDQERERLRESIQRVGATFASNLDRSALLEIGTQTIADAVEADCGRATIPPFLDGSDSLEGASVGDPTGAETALAAAEAQVRVHGTTATVTDGPISALAAPIARDGAPTPDPSHGIVAVARRGRPFSETERKLVTSLARQTGISLENVDLHDQVARQAITDELTGLFNHGRFQQVIAAQAASARRFDQPLGLMMLDIDDFKHVNDTYGHQQGDLVLREIARILRECTREIDEPARYGGEEMAVALQQTDVAGAEAIAERVRSHVEELEIHRVDGRGTFNVTVSCGVAASYGSDPAALIAAADAALYEAKRSGKNRTVRASAPPVAPVG
jgi:diguanylate cyclase (GGDEF)-like protein